MCHFVQMPAEVTDFDLLIHVEHEHDAMCSNEKRPSVSLSSCKTGKNLSHRRFIKSCFPVPRDLCRSTCASGQRSACSRPLLHKHIHRDVCTHRQMELCASSPVTEEVRAHSLFLPRCVLLFSVSSVFRSLPWFTLALLCCHSSLTFSLSEPPVLSYPLLQLLSF